MFQIKKSFYIFYIYLFFKKYKNKKEIFLFFFLKLLKYWNIWNTHKKRDYFQSFLDFWLVPAGWNILGTSGTKKIEKKF
jgi:hypothetical protein